MNLTLAAASIPAGILFANGAEWMLHKHWLHGQGKKKGGFWSFHWREHHRNAQRLEHHDPDYELPLLRSWNGQTKEAAGLLFGALVLAPVAVFAPVFYATILGSTLEYCVKHKRAHLDPAWARDHLTRGRRASHSSTEPRPQRCSAGSRAGPSIGLHAARRAAARRRAWCSRRARRSHRQANARRERRRCRARSSSRSRPSARPPRPCCRRPGDRATRSRADAARPTPPSWANRPRAHRTRTRAPGTPAWPRQSGR